MNINCRNDFANIILDLKTPEAPERSPVDLCLVLDKSGSMGNNNCGRLTKVKATACKIIDGMHEEDRISVVVFSTESDTIITHQLMDVNGKERAKRLINKLTHGGTTNISRGLFAGIDVMSAPPIQYSSLFNRLASFGTPMATTDTPTAPVVNRKKGIILFTDGHPEDDDFGNGDNIAVAIGNALEQRRKTQTDDLSVHAIDLGGSNQWLERIVTSPEYYRRISNEDIVASIQGAFNDIRGLLFTRTQLIVKLPDGVSLAKESIEDYRMHQTHEGYIADTKDFKYDIEKNFVLALENSTGQQFVNVDVTMRGFNTKTGSFETYNAAGDIDTHKHDPSVSRDSVDNQVHKAVKEVIIRAYTLEAPENGVDTRHAVRSQMLQDTRNMLNKVLATYGVSSLLEEVQDMLNLCDPCDENGESVAKKYFPHGFKNSSQLSRWGKTTRGPKRKFV